MAVVSPDSYSKSIPGPAPMSVIGWRGNRLKFGLNRIQSVTDLYEKYGTIAAMVQNDPRRVFAFGPSYNHFILTNPDLFHTTPFLSLPANSALDRLSQGLIMMNGETHRQQRRLMMPAFHKNHLSAYHAAIVDLTHAMMERWQVGQVVHIVDEFRRLALAVTNVTLLGLDDPYGTASLGNKFQQWLRQLTSPWAIIFPIDRFGTPYQRLLRFSEGLEQDVLELVARKQAQPQEQSDVLSMLLQARDEDGQALTTSELVGQVTTLFLASHETTTSALAWTILLLSQHPDIRNDLIDELQSVLKGAAPRIDQFGQLPLLDHVIKESLRLLPPAVYSHRQATEAIELGSYHLPAGSVVTYSPYITHRMPDLYGDPTHFNPHRWDVIHPSPYEYLPFGAGARMCLGAAFANMELMIVLSLLLQHYDFNLLEQTVVDHHVLVTLAPKRDIPMTLTHSRHSHRIQPVKGSIRTLITFPS
jgi:cytochrome P450